MRKVKFEEELKIVSLIEKCKEGDPQALQMFFEYYSKEIYSFPLKIFKFNEDDASDFFLFAFERLRDGKRFSSFRGESTFRTWFYSVLRNLVIDWLRIKGRERMVKISSYSEFKKIDSIFFNNNNFESEFDETILSKEFYQILDEVDDFSRVVYKLVYINYLELHDKDIEYLKKKFQKENYDILKFILEIKSEIMKKRIRNQEKLDKISRLYVKIRNLKNQKEQMKQDKLYDMGIENKEKEIDKILEEKLEKREKLVKTIKNETFFLRVPYEKVAVFLDVSPPTISSIIKKVEIYLKNHEYLKKFFVKS